MTNIIVFAFYVKRAKEAARGTRVAGRTRRIDFHEERISVAVIIQLLDRLNVSAR